MPASPHDALFKSTFEQPDIARSQLEHVLPAAVRADLLREHWGTLPEATLQRILLAIAWSVGLVP